MLDREPFLQAIFAAPDDDLPRLVFADWLDEHGESAWAELIRLQCEVQQLTRAQDFTRLRHVLERTSELASVVFPGWDNSVPSPANVERGFPIGVVLEVKTEDVSDPVSFRMRACQAHPNWYGATVLKVTSGPIVTPEPLVTIMTSPVTANVTHLDLSGREEELPAADDDPAAREFGLIDFVRRPTINTLMVEELAGMRECRRLVSLDLRNNDLGNDALRSLAESPHFIRLKSLKLSEGNRFRGRVWQRVLERFGDVVE